MKSTRIKWKLTKVRHTAHLLHLHVVFLTRKRRPILTSERLENINESVSKLCEKSGVQVCVGGTGRDYFHFVMVYPPSLQISDFVGNLKSISSRRLRSAFPELSEEDAIWSPYYLITSAGGPEPDEIVRNYIATQRA